MIAILFALGMRIVVRDGMDFRGRGEQMVHRMRLVAEETITGSTWTPTS